MSPNYLFMVSIVWLYSSIQPYQWYTDENTVPPGCCLKLSEFRGAVWRMHKDLADRPNEVVA